MISNLKNDNIDFLFKSILQLKTVEECYCFFEDLCTVTEIKSMAQRILVADMLNKHQVYSAIVEKTGASTATISRVNRALLYGDGGYSTILKRMEEEKD